MPTQSNHVFLSYAHKDNDVPEVLRERPGWVTCFEQFFEIEISQAGYSNLKIWRDQSSLERWRDLGQSIEEAIRDCQVLVSIVSPVYVQQPWCQREVNYFADRFGDDARIFKVEKRPVDLEQQPSPLKRRPSIQMYREKGNNKDLEEYYHPVRPAPSPEFVDEIQRLVNQIARCLEDDEKVAHYTQFESDSRTQNVEQTTLFLTMGAPEIQHLRRKIEGELACLGIIPSDETEKTSKFSLHMIGGEIDAEDEKSIISELSEAKRQKLRRVIWVPTHLKHNVRTQNLLNQLSLGELSDENDELIEGSISQLKSYLPELLQSKPREEEDKANPQSTNELLRTLEDLTPDQLSALRNALGNSEND